ncbi:hypothetical protein E2C01_058453 [Portunus trituberculatus]|uniref:Ig-like domain-containing protein n=1 Tax=Portunus trituberculatus TaxID=210409 RepID=A0A5B7GWH3_PORTR|nr:hypothetical protein [Portunus trituberculatus]
MSVSLQGEELNHNVSAGLIQSNQSLVLQQVTRRSSGQYTCSATNLHGIGSSNAVQLSVKCEYFFLFICKRGGLAKGNKNIKKKRPTQLSVSLKSRYN